MRGVDDVPAAPRITLKPSFEKNKRRASVRKPLFDMWRGWDTKGADLYRNLMRSMADLERVARDRL